MAHYEIEIKSLLGDADAAEALRQKMFAIDPATARTTTNKQLNHYFEGGDIRALYERVHPLLSEEGARRFADMLERGSNFSVRTRQKDDEVLVVVKASLDEGTSANTVSRLEFEERVPLSLSELDALLEGAGFTYQAKWSREREEYTHQGVTVCIDKNAGYGYLAEFEKVVDDADAATLARAELAELMTVLGARELAQDRLERMFAHYNQNWRDYYGTDKMFVIE